jgi:hypothetical protein
MECDPRFLRDYRCVVFRTGLVPVVGAGEHDIAVTMWAKLAGRLGVRQDGDAWVVPGFWLGGHRQAMPLHLNDPQAPPAEGEALLERVKSGLALQQWRAQEHVVGVRDAAGRSVVGEIRRTGTFVLQGLPLPDADFDCAPEPPTAGVTFTLVAEPGRVDLRGVVAEGARLPMQVAAVRLTRRARR